jgi:hypothetical protein
VSSATAPSSITFQRASEDMFVLMDRLSRHILDQLITISLANMNDEDDGDDKDNDDDESKHDTNACDKKPLSTDIKQSIMNSLDVPYEGKGTKWSTPSYVTSSILDMYRYDSGNGIPVAQHTDPSLLTLIPISPVSGLDIWRDDTNEWIAIENEYASHCLQSLVVMTGEAATQLSGGHIPAVLHRVRAPAAPPLRHSVTYQLKARPAMIGPRYDVDYELVKLQASSPA